MKLRGNSGVHSFELVAGLMFLVPVILYTVDYAVVMYAGSMNDNCCTTAARAAASGPPTNYTDSSSTPTSRCAAVLQKVAKPSGPVRMQTTVNVAENISSPVPSYGAGGFGGPFLGNVTIKTRCNVYPPFNLPFVPQSVILYTSQTYPWTWVMPANYTPTTTPSGANNAAYNNM